MEKEHIYSVTALFSTPDEIIHAAESVAKAGYTKFDVHTPYPVHGMDKAMRLKPSKLGYFALLFGFLGAISAVAFMTWVTLYDYPLVIGGKPFWSWPAFVPVAFEVTVLSAAVLLVVTMIVLYFRFPNVSHPLHDTPYMKRVSADGFGISIQADDPKFDERKVSAFLEKLGGHTVAPVYYQTNQLDHRKNIFDIRFLGLLAATAVVVGAATYVSLNVILFMEPYSWMSVQPKVIPQSASTLFADGKGMRPPVEGTVARGMLPYPYKGNAEAAARYLVNPLPPTKEVFERGKDRFRIFCSPCHGNFGEGDSRLQGQFPNPPTLHSDKLLNATDGALYHIVTEGQNVMPAYGDRIPREDRWAIIHYVRALQRAHHARETDLQ